jgi:hypothetical protein
MTVTAEHLTPTTGISFFTAPDFDFAARTALGHAGQGIIDVGLVLTTLARIPDGDPTGWFDAWHRTAESLEQQADDHRLGGREDSAGAFYLAASEAYDQALSFVDGMPDDTQLLPTFRRHRATWEKFIGTSGGRHLPVAIPYEGGDLPGYLLRQDASGTRRPTLIVTNGSDGSVAGLWATAIKATLDRGWNAFVFDGPGQQSMLFERGIPFRYDWEAVLTPVIDELITRPDVDPDGLLGYGISQGGYWLPRALAFEHRLRAAVVDSGVMDVARAWNANLPPELLHLLKAGQADLFNKYMSAPADPATARMLAFRARPYGAFNSPFDLFTEVNKYSLYDVVTKISTPLLTTDPADDEFFSGQPQELIDALTCEKKLVRCTAEQGAAGHCEPLARGQVALVMNDWFAEHLAGK